MFQEINHIISRISLLHLNMLLLLGLALFGGAVGGRLFQKLRIPQVVGYIIIGILLGQSGFKVINHEVIEALAPFNYFALGLIGFMVGGELKKEVFAKYGKSFLYILLWEGVTPFILVTIFMGIIGTAIFGKPVFAWSLAVLMGAIASATDPATTTQVLKEYKARGPLTTTIMGIVALDDGLALLLFAIASTVASVISGLGEEGLLNAIIFPFYEIGGAIVIGSIAALILRMAIIKYSEKERILAFCVGIVLTVTGLSLAMNVSMLLSVMTLGIIVVNTAPQKSKEAFNIVEGFTPPIYVLFFVLVGAKLEFAHMNFIILILVVVYLIFGLGGKMIGAYVGGRISGAPSTVTKFLPFALYSQAGIAIGLSILAAQHFPGPIGSTLVMIVTGTTFITQLIGPSFTKFAVIKAKEDGLNFTEEEIIEKSSAKDLMDNHPPIIYESMHLEDILRIFGDNDNLYYPVVNKYNKLRGIITVDGIKKTFMQMDLNDLILAHDLMEPVIAKTHIDAPALEVKRLLDRYNTEYLPVVNKDDVVEGFIERKMLNKFVSTRIMELQKQVDSLG